MITQHQAEKAVYLLKEVDHFINGNLVMPIRRPWIEQRIQLLDEIEANEPMTNGDKWRSMTDEDIAEFLYKDEFARQGHWSQKDILKWLKQEANNV